MRGLVSRNFIRLRRDAGLTQERICELTGMHQSSVSDLEAGTANPTIITLARLGAALGVEPAKLIELDATARRELSAPQRRRKA